MGRLDSLCVLHNQQQQKSTLCQVCSGGSTGYASGKVLKYSPPSLAQQGLALAKAVQHFSCNCSSLTRALLVQKQRELAGNQF